MRLAGKTALITGAARGIGLAFARAYVAEGARVAIADIDIERASVAAEEIGDRAISVPLDVTDQTSVDAAVVATVSQFGQIDILINNAAIFDNLNLAGNLGINRLADKPDRIEVFGLRSCAKFIPGAAHRNIDICPH